MADEIITAQRLREVIEYKPESGEFFWAKHVQKAKPGTKAGCIDVHGYRLIRVDGRLYRANRLAVLYMTGKWPQEHVDHIDGDRANDAWANIRSASRSVNMQNFKKARVDSKSGLLGASWSKAASKWAARIKIGREYKHLGLFLTAEEAHYAYISAKRKYHAGCTI